MARSIGCTIAIVVIAALVALLLARQSYMGKEGDLVAITASNVSSTEATISGTFDTTASVTTTEFQSILTVAGASYNSNHGSFDAGSVSLSIYSNISGLSPSTSYTATVSWQSRTQFASSWTNLSTESTSFTTAAPPVQLPYCHCNYHDATTAGHSSVNGCDAGQHPEPEIPRPYFPSKPSITISFGQATGSSAVSYSVSFSSNGENVTATIVDSGGVNTSTSGSYSGSTAQGSQVSVSVQACNTNSAGSSCTSASDSGTAPTAPVAPTPGTPTPTPPPGEITCHCGTLPDNENSHTADATGHTTSGCNGIGHVEPEFPPTENTCHCDYHSGNAQGHTPDGCTLSNHEAAPPTPAASVTGSPTLSVSAGCASASVSWSSVANATSYEVGWTTTSGNWSSETVSGTSHSSPTLGARAGQTSFGVRVRGKNAKPSEGPWATGGGQTLDCQEGTPEPTPTTPKPPDPIPIIFQVTCHCNEEQNLSLEEHSVSSTDHDFRGTGCERSNHGEIEPTISPPRPGGGGLIIM